MIDVVSLSSPIKMLRENSSSVWRVVGNRRKIPNCEVGVRRRGRDSKSCVLSALTPRIVFSLSANSRTAFEPLTSSRFGS